MDRSEDGSNDQRPTTNDQRGLVVKRGLDAERQGRPAEGAKDSDEEQERSSGRRFDLTGILTTSPQMIPPASQVGRMLSIYLETPAI